MPITMTNWKYGSFLLTSWREYQKNWSNFKSWKVPDPFSTIAYNAFWTAEFTFCFPEDSAHFFLLYEELFPLA